MGTSTYPVRVDASPDPQLSRGLWLVKWVLVVPHVVVLAFLWVAFIVLSFVAFFRWSWRVGYYAYGALATDRYPPFTLADVPDYPAHLEIPYPEHLGRYPPSIFDLVLGMNRWVPRVAAYAGLMTDDYPPFRLDMGPDDPGSRVAIAPGGPPSPTTAGAPETPGHAPTPPNTWSTGRIVTMVLGCLAFVVAGGLLAAGATATVLKGTLQDDDGFFMSVDEELRTPTHAITSVNLETKIADGAAFVPDRLLGDTRLSVAPLGDDEVFVGIGSTDEVAAYLADVGHTVVVDFDTSGIGGEPVYVDKPGGAPETAPADTVRWSAQSSGSGTQDLVWSLEDGDWTVVVMNADGSADVAVDVAVGAELPALWWAVGLVSVLGACLLLLSVVLIRVALRVPKWSNP